MHNAQAEVAEAGKFDFVIINDRFEAALADLHSIVAAQRLRAAIQRQRHAALFAAMHIQ
jgi:guanylate kinase